MKRQLYYTKPFVRALKKFVKKRADLLEPIQSVLASLQADAFDPQLKTHKLAGELSESWACSAGYDLRMLFSFKKVQDAEVIQLNSIGTHDEVY